MVVSPKNVGSSILLINIDIVCPHVLLGDVESTTVMFTNVTMPRYKLEKSAVVAVIVVEEGEEICTTASPYSPVS
jgi:hypothetical protein